MLMAHMAGILAKYNIHLHPNGSIKIQGDAVSVAFAHTTSGSGLYPPEVYEVHIRGRAWPYINLHKTLKEVCKKHDIPLRVIGEAFKI